MTDAERNDRLEQILRSYATGDVARKFIDRLARDPKTTPKTYIEILFAGLQYGNWAWLQR